MSDLAPVSRGHEAYGAPPLPAPVVLLVEADVDLRGAIRDALGAGRCRVDTAASVGEALRCVLRRGYTAVIAAVSPPGIDGLELARLLGRRVQSPRIILLTASSDPVAIREGYAAGASHVLAKPVSLTSLARLVESLAVS